MGGVKFNIGDKLDDFLDRHRWARVGVRVLVWAWVVLMVLAVFWKR